MLGWISIILVGDFSLLPKVIDKPLNHSKIEKKKHYTG